MTFLSFFANLDWPTYLQEGEDPWSEVWMKPGLKLDLQLFHAFSHDTHKKLTVKRQNKMFYLPMCRQKWQAEGKAKGDDED